MTFYVIVSKHIVFSLSSLIFFEARLLSTLDAKLETFILKALQSKAY